MLTNSQEKRLREVIRIARDKGASFAYAAWLHTPDAREGDIVETAFVVGKRKLKLCIPEQGVRITSKKSTSVILAESTQDGANTYALFAEALEQAQEAYTVTSHKDHWGIEHKHVVWVSREDTSGNSQANEVWG